RPSRYTWAIWPRCRNGSMSWIASWTWYGTTSCATHPPDLTQYPLWRAPWPCMLTVSYFLSIGFGAALGAICRWLLGLWLNHPSVALPWGTLAANLSGGYLVGLFLGVLSIYPEVPLW